MTNYIQNIVDEIKVELKGTKHCDTPDALLNIYAFMVQTFKTDITPENVHDAWVCWRNTQIDAAWHTHMVPYERLDKAVRLRDASVVDALIMAGKRRDWDL